ncbi:MAG: hypothetical protein AAF282_05510 [Cyanobacteria bacterium P01_A01_bin.15]
MQFLSSYIFPDADKMEKVLLQLLTAYHFIARGVTFKLREPLSANDDGIEPVISRTGPYTSSDGTQRITYTIHFQVQDDIESTAYAASYQAAKEMTTADPAAGYIAGTP